MRVAYTTNLGKMYHGSAEDFIRLKKFEKYIGQFNLILTSPPFPLNRKKAYGNLTGQVYLDWITQIFYGLSDFLADDGSLVIEIGNCWNSGEPTMSTLPLKTLLSVQEQAGLHLCQSFVWNNPAKLPSPAQWVNVERIRVKDSFTHIWWLSKSKYPKANNRGVLSEYSPSMKKLIQRKVYNSGHRPSEHKISATGFAVDNGGAIPGSVITAANTRSKTQYLDYCSEHDIKPHPARMPIEIPEFFIQLLTTEGDLVFDPFGGSNTTGFVAESLNRRWIAVEKREDYWIGSKGRF